MRAAIALFVSLAASGCDAPSENQRTAVTTNVEAAEETLDLDVGLNITKDFCGDGVRFDRKRNRLGENMYKLAELGSHLAGTTSHKSFVDMLERQVAALSAASGEITHWRESQEFTSWEAKSTSLRLGSQKSLSTTVPVSSYYLRAKPGKVSAPLVFAGAVGAPNFSNVKGKIAVVDLPIVPLPLALLSGSADLVIDPKNTFAFASYKRAWQGLLIPTLEDFAAAGAKAVVFVLDTVAEDALGQVFFSHDFQEIPALIVSKEQRTILTSKKHSWAELELVAEVKKDVSDHLIVELPGSSPDSILISTHTDGQNVIEDNGALGMIELLDHFSKLPVSCRPKSLRFLFATGHMDPGLESAGGFLESHPSIQDETSAAVIVEHLGAMEWQVNGNRYQASGHVEPGLSFVSGNHPEFLAAVKAELQAVGLDRQILLSNVLGQPIFIGEGIDIDHLGIPTFGYVPSPSYLLAENPTSHYEKISLARVEDEIIMLQRVIDRIARTVKHKSRARRLTYDDHRGTTQSILVKYRVDGMAMTDKPLFTWLPGTNAPSDDGLAHRQLDTMVDAGFIGASIGYANGFLDGFWCADLDAKAQAMFDVNDEQSAISAINLGLALDGTQPMVLAGYSQGSWIGYLAGRYAPNLKGSWMLATGHQPFSGAINCVREATKMGIPIRAVNGEFDGVYGGTPQKNRANLRAVSGIFGSSRAYRALTSQGDGWVMIKNSEMTSRPVGHDYMLDETGKHPDPEWDSTTRPWGRKAGQAWLKSLVK